MSSEVALNIVLGSRADMGGFDKALGGMSKLERATDLARTTMAAFGGVVASSAVGILSDAARAAAEDEASVTKLRVAVENSGASWDANVAAIEERIKVGQRLAFSDSDTRDSIAQLATATGSVSKAMELQSVVQDIARGRNISLAAATDIAQKAALGNYGALKKLGIVIDETMTPTQALGELQKRYAGQSEAYGRTTAAAVDRVKDSISEWKDSLGAALGPAQGVIAMLPGLSSGFALLGGGAGIAGAVSGAGHFLALLNPITLGTKAWALAQVALNLVLSANPIAIVVLALAGLAVGLKIAYDNSAEFRGIVQGLFEWLGNLLKPLGWVWDRVMDLAKAFGLLGGASDTMKSDVDADFEGMKSSTVASATAMASGISREVGRLEEYLPAAFKRMKDAGVGDARSMEVDTVLAAMGMSDSVREKIAEMVAGVTGKSAAQRDQIVWDMQTAKLQATLRAAGMSEEVVKSIDSMVFQAKAKLEELRAAHAEKFAAMKDRQAELRDSAIGAALGVDELRESIAQLRDKTINITVNRLGGGGGGVFAASIEMATSGLSPSGRGASPFGALAAVQAQARGEVFASSWTNGVPTNIVDTTKVDWGRALRPQSVRQPIVVPVQIDGREVARAVSEVTMDDFFGAGGSLSR